VSFKILWFTGCGDFAVESNPIYAVSFYFRVGFGGSLSKLFLIEKVNFIIFSVFFNGNKINWLGFLIINYFADCDALGKVVE